MVDSFAVISAMIRIDKMRTGSAWEEGVRQYAHELMGNLLYWTMQGRRFGSIAEAKEAAMQGAGSWRRYSRGGLSLVSDAEIAERLCAPSELKRRKGGMGNPNSNEDWADVQARALSQAWDVLRAALSEDA